MTTTIVAFLLVLFFTFITCEPGPRCPWSGRVRRADPNNNKRFLQCNDGQGRWYLCKEGLQFSEQNQKCISQNRSPQQSSARGNTRREINSNDNTRRTTFNNNNRQRNNVQSRDSDIFNPVQSVDAQDPRTGPSIAEPAGGFDEDRPRPTVDDLYSARNNPYRDYVSK